MEKENEKKKIPIVEGWFTTGGEPHLLGNRCQSCGDYFFPKVSACRNPRCRGKDLEEVPLSRKGKLWSFTVNYYPPPPPYVSPDPFVPYAIGVVDLLKEKLMVLGPVAGGVNFEELAIGMEMELVVEKLFADRQGNETMVWKWKPVTNGAKGMKK